jgi:NAD(P)-dependent dehydrogenase (short-subunit alcohol dehydrogenase family)
MRSSSGCGKERRMSEPLAGRVIVVSGAAGAIGQCTCRLLANDGALLHLIDLRAGALESLRDSLPGGPHTLAVSTLESPQGCQPALADCPSPVFGLVHLAGLYEPHDLSPASRTVYDRALASNTTNAFDLSMAITGRLVEDEPGRLIFASSLAYRRGSLNHVAYAVAKGGIAGLVRGLARTLGPRALVNAVAPGVIESPMADHIIKERRADILNDIILKRLGEPNEVAGVIEFLLGPRAGYINGQIINIDGGYHLS